MVNLREMCNIKKVLLFLVFHLFASAGLIAQPVYPQGYFMPPLDIPLSLAGNFGEIRSNHFHSGFDFRTNGEEGKVVRAVADGYISRIKVSAYGYGNALYITHPNGYVSVYGHLQSYDSVIASYVHIKQYEQESFEVDLFPKKNELEVKQCRQVALSGNSGGSEGPHLHFEIRDAKTEEIINPYFFGFPIEDTIKPEIETIIVYPLNDVSTVNGLNSSKVIDVVPTKKGKLAIGEKLQLSGEIGFGIVTTDVENNSNNRNGTYNYTLTVDSQPVFDYKCKVFAFDKTRYINAHIDYATMKKKKQKFQRCYLLPNNKLDFYETGNEKGRVNINDTLNHKVLFTTCDFFNNCNVLEIVFKGDKVKSKSQADHSAEANYFKWNKSNSFRTDDINLTIPAGSLYDDINFVYKKEPVTGTLLSSIHQVHINYVPLHTSYSLAIRPAKKAVALKDKLLIVSIDEDNKFSSEGGEFEDGFVVTKVRSFGKFAVKADTTKPNIKLLNLTEGKDMSKLKSIKVRVSDNLSGIKYYKGIIDGQWVLMEHDYKENLLTYYFDEKLKTSPDIHIFTIIVSDRKMNVTKLETKFYY